MRNVMFTIVAMLLFGGQINAQMFDWETNDTVQVNDSVGGVYCSIYMENNTGDSLMLDWETVLNTFPSEWDVTLCDYNTCYIGIPSTGSMATLYNGDGEKGFFSLSIITNNTPGIGIMRFHTYNELNPVDGDTATFMINSIFTGIWDISSRPTKLEVFPNPTTDFFTIKGDNKNLSEIWVTDVSGKILMNSNIESGVDVKVNVSHLDRGMYLIKIRDKNNNVSVNQLIKN